MFCWKKYSSQLMERWPDYLTLPAASLWYCALLSSQVFPIWHSWELYTVLIKNVCSSQIPVSSFHGWPSGWAEPQWAVLDAPRGRHAARCRMCDARSSPCRPSWWRYRARSGTSVSGYLACSEPRHQRSCLSDPFRPSRPASKQQYFTAAIKYFSSNINCNQHKSLTLTCFHFHGYETPYQNFTSLYSSTIILKCTLYRYLHTSYKEELRKNVRFDYWFIVRWDYLQSFSTSWVGITPSTCTNLRDTVIPNQFFQRYEPKRRHMFHLAMLKIHPKNS